MNKLGLNPGLKLANAFGVIPTDSSGLRLVDSFTRGDALRACPWLSYSAPLALAFIFRAFDASEVELRDELHLARGAGCVSENLTKRAVR